MTRIVAVLALAACSAPSPDLGRSIARVEMRLEADPMGCDPIGSHCVDFCVDKAGAEIYRMDDPFGLPIGPGKTASCGESIQFDELPAGHAVFVKAWIGTATSKAFAGESAVVTVEANGVTEAAVELEPILPPFIETLSPDPAEPGDEIVLQGDDFGMGGGLSRVEIGCEPSPHAAWADGQITFSPGEDAVGSFVRVRRCGVLSNPAPIRLLPDEPEAVWLDPPGCEGLSVRAMALDPDGQVLMAAACDDGTGELLRLEPDGCTYGSSDDLGGAPTAIAALTDRVLVADERPALTAFTEDDPTDLGFGNRVRAMAALGAEAWIVAEVDPDTTELHRLVGDQVSLVPGISPFELRDVAASDDTVLIAAAGKLIVLDVPSGNSDDLGNVVCDPVAVTARPGNTWAAVACAGVLVGYDLEARQWGPPAPWIVGTDVALDAGGDVAFALGPTGLAASDLADGRDFGPWEGLSDGPLLHAGADRLIGGEEPWMLAAYAGVSLCGGTDR